MFNLYFTYLYIYIYLFTYLFICNLLLTAVLIIFAGGNGLYVNVDC